ncbi:MAG: UDP-GlcNAc:undecaprenyl-phosphate/decaprenyl-phosphate GlcNAc-phosphate transferase [Actinomycetota bacterium]|jgi:UDP-GlcNAc:undecaprenyl-phosphate GlcNAc-1-phosphate transferase|nr:UDP-GlcNAc:undecaprenyl-phosphate/decaprenyl-phosphate GlcNAc-phosphate transferase [Actinomycetota bacterium]
MREYLLILFVAAAVTYLLTPVALRVAVRWGAMTEVRDRDVHAIPTPRLGGVAMLAGFAAALLVAAHLPFLGQVFHDSDDGVALLTGATLICLLGIADDKWQLDAVTKLAGQVLAAGVMVLLGVQMLYLPIGPGLLGGDSGGPPGAFVLGPAEGGVLTILIVVVTINAVNFVDGLDGLAAGIVAIAATAFFAFSYLLAVDQDLRRATTSSLVTAALIGVCLGFLPHNFSPARVFMGDSGSMLIGLLLASSTITLTGTLDPNQVTLDIAPAILPLVLPIAVLVVPFADLLLAVVRRTRAGRSPFAPDKQHLHHRLLEIGHSHGRAVLIMYLWSAVIAFGATAVAFLNRVALVVSLVAIVAAACLATVNIPRLRSRRR